MICCSGYEDYEKHSPLFVPKIDENLEINFSGRLSNVPKEIAIVKNLIT